MDRLPGTSEEQPSGRRGYHEVMAAQPVMTAEELAEARRHASPPSADDVTILRDGRRIDSRESAMAWLAELAAARAGTDAGAR